MILAREFSQNIIYYFFESRILYFQEYNSRELTDHCEHATKAVLYACPYANQC
jgi:hypothetical protein